ncbi:Adenine phosphoribosyltransferase [Fusarium oxysporum f. sp. albedinis]|nr:Adenine phosphoribosyltransferase [Fusarium oxysporum f. sp. albedinis]
MGRIPASASATAIETVLKAPVMACAPIFCASLSRPMPRPNAWRNTAWINVLPLTPEPVVPLTPSLRASEKVAISHDVHREMLPRPCLSPKSPTGCNPYPAPPYPCHYNSTSEVLIASISYIL